MLFVRTGQQEDYRFSLSRFFSSTNNVRLIPFMTGLLMSLNFLLFWALPVGGMGYIYKAFFKQFLKPIYDFFDKNSVVRSFAENYIYTKPEHADYFVISSLLTINCIISLSTLFYWQLFVGDLPKKNEIRRVAASRTRGKPDRIDHHGCRCLSLREA